MSSNYPIGGRFRHFLPFWQTICKDNKVIKLIKGIEFEFTEKVVQNKYPRPITMSAEGKSFMDKKIAKLLANDSIKEVKLSNPSGWLSNVFFGPEKRWQFLHDPEPQSLKQIY